MMWAMAIIIWILATTLWVIAIRAWKVCRQLRAENDAIEQRLTGR